MKKVKKIWSAWRVILSLCVLFGTVQVSVVSAATASVPAVDAFTPTGSMSEGRYYHSATELLDGNVLIVGGYHWIYGTYNAPPINTAEMYDVATGTFIPTASNLNVARSTHTATRLLNGRVLITGGTGSSAEVFDPSTRTFTLTGSMTTVRTQHVAVTLLNGKVLVAAGTDGYVSLDTAELYDPATGTFTAIASRMSVGRLRPSATLLADGKVLIAGGFHYSFGSLNSADVYDPTTNTFSPTNNAMSVNRERHVAVRLHDGRVLLAGGFAFGSATASADLYDPASRTFSPTGAMVRASHRHAASLLQNGEVLLTGGDYGTSAEIYNPTTATFRLTTGSLSTDRVSHTSTLLSTGQVLISGGLQGPLPNSYSLTTAELYTPFNYTPVPTPTLTPITSLIASSANGTELYPGNSVSVDLTIQNADNLYAAQATCTVDPAILVPQGGTYGNFFDPVNRLEIPIQVDATSGRWIGAISQRNPAPPLSGNGLFATVDYQAVNPGTTSVTCSPMLSDQNGFTQPVTFTGLEITILPFATVNGTAQYQGRTDHSGIIITATGPVTVNTLTDSAGNFVLSDLQAGDYTVTASADGYLTKSVTVTATSGESVALPATTLQGGDPTGDNVIDIGDATLVAANFGLAVPPGDARADINGDGVVNVQDLAILGSNYGLAGDQAW